MKACSSCKAWKSYDSFAANRSKPDGLQNVCRSCFKSYRQENAERIADMKLRRNFHLSLDDFTIMAAEQQGACRICRQVKPLCVDHDHRCCPGPRSCGQCVRGLLCHSCNRALGLFGDDAARLAAAAEYLGWPKPSRPVM